MLKILLYPDPRLRQMSKPVDEITDEVRFKASVLTQLVRGQIGMGLAAPQLGWPVRLVVFMESCGAKDSTVIVNPEVVENSGPKLRIEEGCLSIPHVFGRVRRKSRVTVQGTDLDGEPVTITSTGLTGRCLLHEIDHLDGILFIDRLSPVKKQSIRRKLRALEAAALETDRGSR